MMNFPQTKALTWTGRVVSVISVAPFILSSTMKLINHPTVAEGMAHAGIPETLIRPLGILEMLCVIIYLIPQTATLGAILLTGYLGGAILTHLRIGEPVVIQATIGIVIWAGLWLREARLRAIMPLRQI